MSSSRGSRRDSTPVSDSKHLYRIRESVLRAAPTAAIFLMLHALCVVLFPLSEEVLGSFEDQGRGGNRLTDEDLIAFAHAAGFADVPPSILISFLRLAGELRDVPDVTALESLCISTMEYLGVPQNLQALEAQKKYRQAKPNIEKVARSLISAAAALVVGATTHTPVMYWVEAVVELMLPTAHRRPRRREEPAPKRRRVHTDEIERRRTRQEELDGDRELFGPTIFPYPPGIPADLFEAPPAKRQCVPTDDALYDDFFPDL
eukprot:TRINITY_DN795_c0_g1_i2.p2 TRINITY_DN795_c0_g1~~TRINITY_DN795_c0_g1_i2.p2  ORF type:complete len:261 (+),score=48.50 TRINITY_DN795_c0_g1_i2:117-899(+)